MVQQYVAAAQGVIQQATVVATQFAATVSKQVDALNIPAYTGPALAHAQKVVTPFLQQAGAAAQPFFAPYLELLQPYLGGAKPHLDKVTAQEICLLMGGLFGGILVLQLLFALTAVCRRGASPLKAFTPTVFWLLLCTIVHCWIEYHFVFNRTNGKSGFQASMDLYGAADMRYGFAKNPQLEPGTAAMEAITALITGPMCLLLAWGIVGNKAWRWPLQVIVSSFQIYGLIWFCMHPVFSTEEVASKDPFLYWVIFIGFNAPWGIIPPILLLQAIFYINAAITRAQIWAAAAAEQKKALSQLKKTK